MQAKILSGIGAAALVALLIPFAALVNGYTLAALWGWFVVPYFHVPALSIVLACGLSMLASFTFGHDGEAARNREREQADKALKDRFETQSSLILSLSNLIQARAGGPKLDAKDWLARYMTKETGGAAQFFEAMGKALFVTLARSGVVLLAGWLLSLCL